VICRLPPLGLLSKRAAGVSPFQFAEITFTGIGPSAPVVIEDFAQLVEYFRFDPQGASGQKFRRWLRPRVPLSIEHTLRQFPAGPDASLFWSCGIVTINP
jgi:hypothetical protein